MFRTLRLSNLASSGVVPTPGGSHSIVGRVSSCAYSTLPTEAKVVRYERHGDPHKVLSFASEPLPPVGDDQILLKTLYAPINPSDINMVQGVYPIRPSLPAVGGNEGVSEVLAVGSNVSSVSSGDWVFPAKPGFGTWRTHAVANESDVLKVRKDLKPEYAATLSVNVCSAYRMLEDFVHLKEGDVLIQNGANSGVGQAVMQLARNKGVKTINVIRDRPDYDDTVERMKAYGAHLVVTEEILRSTEFPKLTSDLPKPQLALNCVGGESAVELVRALGEGGTMVTYGGMSKKPVVVPTSHLIFKNVTLKGFWMSKWIEQNSQNDRMSMINELYDIARADKLRVWTEKHPFSEEDFHVALSRSLGEQRNRKVLLAMDE